MDIRRLVYFARIAEDGSLTKAAGVLRIAQPALSRQIRLLEAALGVRLFLRTARGMRLTEEGEYLQAAAAGPLRALAIALQNVRSFATRIEGSFALGMPSSVGDMLAKTLVLHMSTQLPQVKLRLIEGSTGSLIDWLNRGIIDFAILEEASRDARLVDVELLCDRLVLVGAMRDFLPKDQAIDFKKAACLPLILPSHHLGIRGRINETAAKSRAALNIHLEIDSTTLIKELVKSGAGYSILPALYVAHDIAAGTLQSWPIVAPALSLSIFLSSRQRGLTTKTRIEDTVFENIVTVVQSVGRSRSARAK